MLVAPVGLKSGRLLLVPDAGDFEFKGLAVVQMLYI